MGDLFAPSHILLIIIFALLFFGPKKLPELGRSMGKTIRAFREGTKDALQEQENAPRTAVPDVVSAREIESKREPRRLG